MSESPSTGEWGVAAESAEELASRQRVESYLFRMASEVSTLSWDEWKRACARREMEWCRQATICQETGVKANALRWDRLVDDGILERADGGSRRVYYRISPAHHRYLAKGGVGGSPAKLELVVAPQTTGGNPPDPVLRMNESTASEKSSERGTREVPVGRTRVRSFPELCLSAREHVGAAGGFKVAHLRVELSQTRDGVFLVVHRRSGRRFRVTQGPDGAMIAFTETEVESG